MKLLRLYDRCLTARPILTKCITSGCLFGIGDGVAQRVTTYYNEHSSRSTKHDWHRTGRMIIWGSVFFAPSAHVWYNFLDRFVRTTGRKAIVQKVAMDLLIYTPPLNMAFFTCNNVLSGQPLDEAAHKAWVKLPPTLAANFAVWPGIQVVTFGYVPLQYRVLFINFMCLGWSSFLSMMASDPDLKPAAVSTSRKYEADE